MPCPSHATPPQPHSPLSPTPRPHPDMDAAQRRGCVLARPGSSFWTEAQHCILCISNKTAFIRDSVCRLYTRWPEDPAPKKRLRALTYFKGRFPGYPVFVLLMFSPFSQLRGVSLANTQMGAAHPGNRLRGGVESRVVSRARLPLDLPRCVTDFLSCTVGVGERDSEWPPCGVAARPSQGDTGRCKAGPSTRELPPNTPLTEVTRRCEPRHPILGHGQHALSPSRASSRQRPWHPLRSSSPEQGLLHIPSSP